MRARARRRMSRSFYGKDQKFSRLALYKFHRVCAMKVVNKMSINLIDSGAPAPDFELDDVTGKRIRLSDFQGGKVVVLAFLRGFM